jgi:Reverse transcriptase (RNA-dependent DNA polymerase)
LTNLISKNTFEITKNYEGETCLPVCAIFRTKIKANGTVDKLKVRIAIRGDLDRDALDEDNSAPLATFRLLKVFLAEAARLKRRVYQADFIGAYLQAKMDRLVYVILPKEYAIYFPDLAKWFGIPLILRKSAYGINSAGQLWAEELFGWYIELGFSQSLVEPSLFKYKKENDWIILVSYCDDTAYFASSDKMRKKFEKAMCQRFDCKLLGQLHWFLQARITQDAEYNITIDQSRYCASMSKRFLPNEEIVAPSAADQQKYLAPLPNGMVFTKEDRSTNENEVRGLQAEFQLNYPSVIGSLLWILNTYPRLQFAIQKLAKFMNLLGRVHFKGLQHLLHHVRCYHLCGLKFYSDVMNAPIAKLLLGQGIDPTKSPFFAFADSSWGDCPDTSRSTGGYHIILQGGITDSATTFPTPVARSSAEAEYMNASLASAAVNAMAMLVQDIRFGEPDLPLRIPMLLDNKACISMGESFRDSKRTRHILREYQYSRWMIKDGRIVFVWIPSHLQLADAATKNLIGTSPTLVLFREIFETMVIL